MPEYEVTVASGVKGLEAAGTPLLWSSVIELLLPAKYTLPDASTASSLAARFAGAKVMGRVRSVGALARTGANGEREPGG